MRASRYQLTLPILDVPRALVEVVMDFRRKRVRVRPVDYDGWVKFPKRLREIGAVYRVELLKTRPGGAWTATGRIRRVRF